MIKQTLQRIIGYCKCRLNGIRQSGKCYIGLNCKIVNRGSMLVGEGVIVRPSTDMYTSKGAQLIIESHAEIGRMSTLSAVNQIVIGGGANRATCFYS